MYRLILESLLGLTRTATQLTLAPRMPAAWDHFTLTYRHGEGSYVIRVVKSAETAAPVLTVDGVRQLALAIDLHDTASIHKVELLMPTKLNS